MAALTCRIPAILTLAAALFPGACAGTHGDVRGELHEAHEDDTIHAHGPSAALTASPAQPSEPVGYTDTPMLPGGEWRVHDRDRPVPPVVSPGLHGGPPSDAEVLFDGTDLAAWSGGPWALVDGAMEVNGKGDLRSKASFGSVQLHIEWMAPPVASESQGRGNSGLFLMDRYEVQVLDSWGNRTYADGQAAALYGQTPPDVNATRAPGAWQTYDILFTAPRFDGETVASPARITVIHNGVVVHHEREYLGGTTHQRVASYEPHPAEGPIRLQDHGNPVRFRNIWVRRLDD
jgi:hypothetical protein